MSARLVRSSPGERGRGSWPSSPSPLSFHSLSGASQHGVHVVAQVQRQERGGLGERVHGHLVLVSIFTAASLFNV